MQPEEPPIKFFLGNQNYFVLDSDDFNSFLWVLDQNYISEFYLQGHPTFRFPYDWETNRITYTNVTPILSMRILCLQINMISTIQPTEEALLRGGNRVLIPAVYVFF